MRTLKVLKETTVTFAELRQRVEGVPKRRTLYQWTRVGLLVRAGKHEGQLVTLEFANRGNMPVTSLEAYYRFQAVLNGQSNKLAEVLFPNEEARNEHAMQPT